MAYNRIILMGRLTRDPELREPIPGRKVCDFSIAVDRRTRKGMDDKDNTDFFRCSLWGERGEFVSKYFKKGNMILVEGECHLRKYTTSDGREGYSLEVAADNAAFSGEKNSDSSGGASSYSGGASYSQPNAQSSQSKQESAPAADFSSADSDGYPF